MTTNKQLIVKKAHSLRPPDDPDMTREPLTHCETPRDLICHPLGQPLLFYPAERYGAFVRSAFPGQPDDDSVAAAQPVRAA